MTEPVAHSPGGPALPCLFNLSAALLAEDVSPGNEKPCRNYAPRGTSGFVFKEIALQSGMCNPADV